MIEYLVFYKNESKQPTVINAKSVFHAYSMVRDQSKVAFITVSENDPTFDFPDGQLYSKHYLDNPHQYEEALPF